MKYRMLNSYGRRLWCLKVFGLLVLSAMVRADDVTTEWAFDRPALATLRQSQKKVFAHYFTPFPISLDNRAGDKDYYAVHYLNPKGEKGKFETVGGYLRQRPLPRPSRSEADWQLLDMKEEVRRAVALGLDGFVCDILDHKGVHFERVKLLLEAANQVDPGFKIVLMPDMQSKFKDQPERLTETIRTLSAYPAVYRMNDGRVVVAPYNAQRQSVDWWKDWLRDIRGQNVKVAFMPLFQGWGKYAADFASISAGMSDWGSRSPKAQARWRNMASEAHKYTSIWMTPVSPQDMRPRSSSYTETSNSESFRIMWQNAISGGADWVQLITWNDYSEASEIAPSTHTQYAFYDLTAYYTTWFKTGRPPRIVRDVLYYFHRVQSLSVPSKDNARPGTLRASAGSDPPSNEIELLAFLAQPGTLEIEIGGRVQRQEAQAGITEFRIPLREGRPKFRLVRQGTPVISLESAFTISNARNIENLLYHAGSSSRPPVIVPDTQTP